MQASPEIPATFSVRPQAFPQQFGARTLLPVAAPGRMRYLVAMALDKVAELVAVAKTLSLAERRRLVVELDSLAAREAAQLPAGPSPLAALTSLAGTAHSDFDDLSTDKYAHVAAAVSDESDS